MGPQQRVESGSFLWSKAILEHNSWPPALSRSCRELFAAGLLLSSRKVTSKMTKTFQLLEHVALAGLGIYTIWTYVSWRRRRPNHLEAILQLASQVGPETVLKWPTVVPAPAPTMDMSTILLGQVRNPTFRSNQASGKRLQSLSLTGPWLCICSAIIRETNWK